MLLPSSHNNIILPEAVNNIVNNNVIFTKAVNKQTDSLESSLGMKNQSLHIKQKTTWTCHWHFVETFSLFLRNYFFRVHHINKHVYRFCIDTVFIAEEFERNYSILFSTRILTTSATCNHIVKIISKTEVT